MINEKVNFELKNKNLILNCDAEENIRDDKQNIIKDSLQN